MHIRKHFLGLLVAVAGLASSTFAGTLTNVSITGSDLSPGATSDYTFSYTVETTVPDDQRAFCISGNPWGTPLDIFQHSISISVDGSPATIDNSGIFGNVGLGGAYCRSISTTVNSGSIISATISGLTNPIASWYGVWLLTYHFEFLGSSYVIDGLSGDTALIKIGNPITSCDDLANINNNLSLDYELTEDLDCSGSGNSIMIGTNNNPFQGNFEGNDHSITVAFDTGYSGTYGGLFRYVTGGGSIENLTVLGTVHLDATEVGGVVGKAWMATLNNVHFSGDIIVGENQISIGGIAGRLEDSTLSGSSAHGTVQALLNASTVGGLVGLMSADAIIRYSYADNDVSGYYNVGGLVGEGYGSSMIENSYAAGDIESRAVHGGGIIGYADQTYITNAYALGSVYATDNAGGLAGDTRGLYVTNAYTAGSVYTGAAGAGGLLGGIEGGMGALPNEITGYFWDVDTSHMPGYYTMATGALDGTTGLTTSQMHNKNNYINAGWDFTGVWAHSAYLNGGYPYLQWQGLVAPTEGDLGIYIGEYGPMGQGSMSYSYEVEYFNNSDNDINDAVIIFSGDISSTGWNQASGGSNNVVFSGVVEGSSLQWVVSTIPAHSSGSIGFVITQANEGFYPYTATITGGDYVDTHTGDNTFSIISHVDITSPVPLMASPDVNNGATTSVRNVRFLTMFDEDISDFTSGDVTVTNGTLVGFDVETFYSSFTFTIVPTAAGPVTVTIATGVLSDDIGNPNTAATYTFTYSPAVSGGGGGGGGGSFVVVDECPNGDASSSFYDGTCGDVGNAWLTFFTQVSGGGISNVSGGVITVRAFVSDVFKLLHITKPIHRKADSDTKAVPGKLVIKVMQILKKLLVK